MSVCESLLDESGTRAPLPERDVCRAVSHREPLGAGGALRRARHRGAARSGNRGAGGRRGRSSLALTAAICSRTSPVRGPARSAIPTQPRADARCCCARTSTPSRSQAPVEPVLRDGMWENANEGSWGRTTRRRWPCMLALCATAAGGARRLTWSCSSPSARRPRWRARACSTCHSLRSDFGYVFDHASPIGEVVVDSRPTTGCEASLPRGGGARGICPELGRSAILAAARAVA